MRLLTLVLVSTLVSTATSNAEACGDKFLRVGRGARYQRAYVAVHPATLLLVARPGSTVAATLKELEPTLKRAGHKSVVVRDAAAVPEALEHGHFNIVLTDIKDIPALEGATRSTGARVDVLPLLGSRRPRRAPPPRRDITASPRSRQEVRGARQDRRDHGVRPQGYRREQSQAAVTGHAAIGTGPPRSACCSASRSGPVSAQAWLPTKGEGAIGLTFGDYGFDGHFDSEGRRIPTRHQRPEPRRRPHVRCDRPLRDHGQASLCGQQVHRDLSTGVLLGPLDMDRGTTGTSRTSAASSATWSSRRTWR